jgi:hypothetical protein
MLGNGGFGGVQPITSNTPSGWTSGGVDFHYTPNGTYELRLNVFSKTATSGDISAGNVTVTSNNTTSCLLSLNSFQGNTYSVETVGSATNGSGTTATAASITTAGVNRMVFAVSLTQSSSASGVFTGFTRVATTSGGITGTRLEVDSNLFASAGATGSTTGTVGTSAYCFGGQFAITTSATTPANTPANQPLQFRRGVTLGLPTSSIASGEPLWDSTAYRLYVSDGSATHYIGGSLASSDLPSSLALAGSPTTTTQSANDNSTKIATTAYVDTGLALKSNIASPTFTGTPAAPTATGGTNTTQVATTAFVTSATSALAPLASPALTGNPTAPTQTAGNNSTRVATTAYVDTGLALKANLASPALTGSPTAPTQLANDNSTKIATTAYVDGQVVLFPPIPIFGLNFSYLTGTTYAVSTGGVSDSTWATYLQLYPGTTIDSSVSGLGGLDIHTMVGTCATGAGTTVTGTSTAFLADFGTRLMDGTISSSTTTVTGTNTLFLTEIAVNDMIGNASKGFYKVTAIASNTSLTLVSAPGSAFSTDTPNCIEQPTFKAGTNELGRVNTITSNTTLTTVISGGGVVTGLTPYCGMLSHDTTANSFNHVFIVGDGVTVGVVQSTQRTTPFISDTYQYFRRVGAIVWDTGGTQNIVNFMQIGNDYRTTHLMINETRFLSAGASTSFAKVNMRGFVPPTSNYVQLKVQNLNTAAASTAYLRTPNLPGTIPTTGPYAFTTSAASSYGDQRAWVFTDWSQQIEYAVASSGTMFLSCQGFVEII